MKSSRIFQDQADAYVNELEIPDTLAKLKETGKGTMLSFWCNVNNCIDLIHAFNDEGC